MTLLTAARVSEMPRVNLLPPEIAAAAKLRKLQILLGLLVLGAFVIAGLLFMWAGAKVSAEQKALDEATAEGTSLTAEKAQYSEVPEVDAALLVAETNKAQAMAPEIRWSYLMNDLALTTPSGVRLVGMTAVNSAATAQVTPEPFAPVTTLGQAQVGTVEFTGKANDIDSVVSWMNSLARQSEWFLEPTVSSIAKVEAEDTVGDVYDYAGMAYLGTEALSGRGTLAATEGE